MLTLSGSIDRSDSPRACTLPSLMIREFGWILLPKVIRRVQEAKFFAIMVADGIHGAPGRMIGARREELTLTRPHIGPVVLQRCLKVQRGVEEIDKIASLGVEGVGVRTRRLGQMEKVMGDGKAEASTQNGNYRKIWRITIVVRLFLVLKAVGAFSAGSSRKNHGSAAHAPSSNCSLVARQGATFVVAAE